MELCLCQYVMPKQFYHSKNYLNFTYDEPTLASIMTHDTAKNLCASELGSLNMLFVECMLECMLEHAVLVTEQLGLTRCF